MLVVLSQQSEWLWLADHCRKRWILTWSLWDTSTDSSLIHRMPILDNGIARSQIGRLDLTVVTLILRSLLRCFDGFSAMFYCEYYQTAELISGINPVRIILVTCFNCSRFKFHRLWIYAKQSRKRREILYTTNNLSTTRQSWVDLYVMRLPKRI